jgi:murein DD-endopeptidase MepM/ murein hydrolase activator NlpD
VQPFSDRVSDITWALRLPDDPASSRSEGEASDMDRYTLILVPEGIGEIRRCHVRRAWLRWLGYTCLLGVLSIAAGTYDWMRVRREAAEVRRLRAEVLEHRDKTSALEDAAGRVQLELDRLQEFERRVRVIANLPARLEASAEGPPGGVGGGAESRFDAMPPIGVPTGAFNSKPEPTHKTEPKTPPPPAPSAPGPGAALDPAETPAAREEKLERRARLHARSLEELLQQLEGKGERLASTPSVWPAHGWLTSQFGWRISPFTGRRDLHEGVDIAADFGTPVTAPARGSVAFGGTKGPLGTTIVIEHGYGVKTTYGHLREALVHAGDQVERGQTIATIGNSGRSTGPHLHYAIEVKGRLVDPLDYIIE